MSATSLLEQVQEDCQARLLADDYFADVAIALQRKAVVERESIERLMTLNARAGKTGAGVLVLLPRLLVPEPNPPGPYTSLLQSFLVMEHPSVNAGDLGTGKSAEKLAVAVLQLFHHFLPFGLTQVFTAIETAITPNVEFEGKVAYLVSVRTFVTLARPAKCSLPQIALSSPTAATNVTLSCPTAGAAIYYTLDCSYPSPANEEAVLYTAPFAVADPATVRAAASKTGLQQSDIAQLRIL